MSEAKMEAIGEITVAYIEAVIDEFDWDDTKELNEAIYDFIRGLDDVLSEVKIKADRSEE
jgi:hypothetical protein